MFVWHAKLFRGNCGKSTWHEAVASICLTEKGMEKVWGSTEFSQVLK